jgi:DNA-binding MarR family transcriptional regulator
MNEETRDNAALLEELLPRLMRTLYKAQESDPIQNLPVAQVRVLRVLFNGPKNHSAVSEELGISVSAVTQVANRLESIGLIERIESAIDRRVKHLKLTQYGLTCMKERQDYRIMRTMNALESMPIERQHRLIDALNEFLAGCKERDVRLKGGIYSDIGGEASS